LAEVAGFKKPKICDFDIYRKIRENKTKFRKNGCLISTKAGILVVQTAKAALAKQRKKS
jgi:hypothetical protein